jgi:hypothetical protein
MKKITLKALAVPSALMAVMFVSPAFSLAAQNADGGGGTIDLGPPAGAGLEGLAKISIANMVPVVIQVALIVAAVVALIFLIIGGIKWITSGGDKTAVEGARNTITAALIGLVIVFAAWAIIKLIETFFGTSILTEGLTIPTIAPD